MGSASVSHFGRSRDSNPGVRTKYFKIVTCHFLPRHSAFIIRIEQNLVGCLTMGQHYKGVMSAHCRSSVLIKTTAFKLGLADSITTIRVHIVITVVNRAKLFINYRLKTKK